MAGNQKAIKQRIKSVQSTKQICKAMELVAASRMHKATERAQNSKPYFESMQNTLAQIARKNTSLYSPYVKGNGSESWCYILIAGDRGFAGGYNNNLFHLVEQEMEGKDCMVFPIGKKSYDRYSGRSVPIISDSFMIAQDISVSDCFEIARIVCSAYRKGAFGHLTVAYTKFVNMMTQEPELIPLLPLPEMAVLNDEEIGHNRILYEPSAETVFDTVVPEYLAGLIYGALSSSVASELAARRMMMDAATKNAEEMIDKLNLHYNRVRQAGITQEITEIVAGADAG